MYRGFLFFLFSLCFFIYVYIYFFFACHAHPHKSVNWKWIFSLYTAHKTSWNRRRRRGRLWRCSAAVTAVAAATAAGVVKSTARKGKQTAQILMKIKWKKNTRKKNKIKIKKERKWATSKGKAKRKYATFAGMSIYVLRNILWNANCTIWDK